MNLKIQRLNFIRSVPGYQAWNYEMSSKVCQNLSFPLSLDIFRQVGL
jgi:hypothetical protein